MSLNKEVPTQIQRIFAKKGFFILKKDKTVAHDENGKPYSFKTVEEAESFKQKNNIDGETK